MPKWKKGEKPAGATPFKPGQTGNPKGRPRKLPELDTLLADVLSRAQPGRKIYGEDISQAEAILLSMIKEAKKGNVRAAELVLDRAYGKAVQPVQGSFTGNLVMQFDNDDQGLGDA